MNYLRTYRYPNALTKALGNVEYNNILLRQAILNGEGSIAVFPKDYSKTYSIKIRLFYGVLALEFSDIELNALIPEKEPMSIYALNWDKYCDMEYCKSYSSIETLKVALTGFSYNEVELDEYVENGEGCIQVYCEDSVPYLIQICRLENRNRLEVRYNDAFLDEYLSPEEYFKLS